MGLLALVVLLALPRSAALGPGDSRTAVEDPEEYAVWSAALTYAYPVDASRQLVIQDRTCAIPERLTDPSRPFHSTWSEIKIVEDASRQSYAVEKEFTLKLPYVLISKEEEPELSQTSPSGRTSKEDAAKMQNDWDQFYKKYPGAYGILELSRVGFLNHRTQAAVFVESIEGVTTSAGRLYFLTKKNGFWKVQQNVSQLVVDGRLFPEN
jgi:hypothetical protein